MITKELLAQNPSMVIGFVAAFGIAIICLMEGMPALSLGAFFACGIYFAKLNAKNKEGQKQESQEGQNDGDG